LLPDHKPCFDEIFTKNQKSLENWIVPPRLENNPLTQSDILFSLSFGKREKEIKFDNTEKNGHYRIKGKDEVFEDDLLLEFKKPDQMLGWPGGWVWRPPARIPLDSIITMQVVPILVPSWKLNNII
jgi:hypothetical protein